MSAHRQFRHGVTNIEYVMIAFIIGLSMIVISNSVGDGMEKITSLVAADFEIHGSQP